MSIKQLLAGASLAALVGGAASAQLDVTYDAGADSTIDGDVIASEIVLSATNSLDGTVEMLFDFADGAGPVPAYDDLGAAQDIEIVITLTNGTFTSPVDPAAWSGAGDCDFTVSDNGGAGDTTVTLESTGQVNLCQDPAAALDLAISVEGAPFDIAWATNVKGGAARDNGTLDADNNDANGQQALLTQSPAYSVAYVAGAPADLATPNFVDFDGAGDVEETFGTFQFELEAGVAVDLAGAVPDADDVLTDNNTLTVTFTDATGIDQVEFNSAQLCNPTGNTCVISLSGANIQGAVATADDIDITIDGVTAVDAQPVAVELSLEAHTNYTVAPITGLSGNLAPINRDDGNALFTVDPATTNLPFEWVKIGAGGTENNFRLSGPFSAGSIAGVIVTLGNGNNDNFPASIELAPSTDDDATTGFRIKNNVLSFTSAALGNALSGAAAGESGNANITGLQFRAAEDKFCDNDLNNDGTVVAVGADDSAGDNGCTTNVVVSVAIAGVTNLDGEVTIDRLLINRSELGLSDL